MTGCHTDLYTVSRCHTRDESEEWHVLKKACKQEIHPGFETQGRHHQAKTGVFLASQKGLMSPKNKKNKLNECNKSVNYEVWCPLLHTERSLVREFNGITSIYPNCA